MRGFALVRRFGRAVLRFVKRLGTRIGRVRITLIQVSRVVGLLLIAGGFVAIYLGWDGMARLTCVDCQLPYLLSGGVTGLGLIVLGSAVLVIAQMRAERMRLFQTLERAREDDPRVRMDDTVVLEEHEPETVGAPPRS